MSRAAATVDEPVDASLDLPDVHVGARPGLRHWAAVAGLLALRTFRLRYLRSRLGIGWAFLQPLVQAAVLAFIFLKVFRIARVPHYPLYVLAGVMTWQAFAGAVSSATTSAVDNAALLRKVDMPALVFPVSQVGAVLGVFVMQSVILLGLAGLSGTLSPKALLLPVVFVLVALLATGVGCLMCAFHVAVRDVKFLVESGLLMLFYGSPILYDPARVPERIRSWLELNPVFGILTLARGALLDRPVDGQAVAVSVAVTLVLLVVGVLVFRRRSADFADLA